MRLTSLYDKTILLYGENRFSDTIQFCRYVPLVAARGAKIILQVPEELHSLARSLTGGARLMTEGETPPYFDFHCPLPDLPAAFGTRLDTIPSGVPYFRPPTEALLDWEGRLGELRRPRIGFAWAGHPKKRKRSRPFHRSEDHAAARRRRCDLDAASEGLCVRVTRRCSRPGPNLRPNRDCEDLCDAAALISRLDLVISVDTAIAHLAGALGKPVWVLLPFTPHWRWLLERSASIWNPTARLYRQTKPGEWDDVIARIAADLPGATGKHSQARATSADPHDFELAKRRGPCSTTLRQNDL